MIIPNFKCHQDDRFVYIEIKAPNCKLENTEFDLFNNQIIFNSPPYHLRLNLPGDIIPTDDGYDLKSKTNEFVLKVKKLNENEHFDGLDLISKLLTTPKENELRKKNLIEVLDNDRASIDKFDLNDEEDVNYDIFDENLELNQFIGTTRSVLETKFKYGFLNSYSDLIEKYQDDLWRLTDLQNPGELSIDERHKARSLKENDDFDEEHYLCDQFEDKKLIDELRTKESFWLNNRTSSNESSNVSLNVSSNISSNVTSNESSNISSNVTSDVSSNVSSDVSLGKELDFTDDEIFRLKNLPRKEFTKLNREEKIIILYGLVDILYAYCYDKRINEGEQTSESAWTISKLSSTLSWFDVFWEIDDLLESCLRRSLCYPLYRNCELSRSILEDVIKLLTNGQVFIVKCLLEIHKLFNEYGEFKFLLNDLFINDFIIVTQYLDQKYFNRLIELLKSKLKTISKDRLGFDLVLLDKAGEEIILEQIRCLDIQ